MNYDADSETRSTETSAVFEGHTEKGLGVCLPFFPYTHERSLTT